MSPLPYVFGLTLLPGCAAPTSDSGVETPQPTDSDTAPVDSDTAPVDSDTAPVDSDLDDSVPSPDPQTLVMLADADARLLGEHTDDAAGGAVNGAGDPDGDGLTDLLVVAPDNDRDGDDAGAIYLVSGTVRGHVDLGGATAILTPGSTSGAMLAIGLGDIDGDGFGELAAAAGVSSASWDEGTVVLFRGPVVGAVSFDSAPWRIDAEAGGDGPGGAMATGVDVDGDGVPDLVAGARYNDGAERDAGAVYVVSGLPADAHSSFADSAAIWRGEEGDDHAGRAVAAGDADGDGVGDLLIGGDAHADYLGAAWLVIGPCAGEHGLADADARMTGGTAYDAAGVSVAVSPDLDGDGAGDLVVGASRVYGGEGVVWIVPGSVRGDTIVDDVAQVALRGNHANDTFGSAAVAAGDLDGDGAPDLLVGAPNDDPGLGWVGSVFGFLGPLEGTLTGGDAALKYAAEGETWMGWDVAAVGDVDGDGCDDVLIGDQRADGMEAGSGGAYVVLGGGA